MNHIAFQSAIGWITVSASSEGICRVDYYGDNPPSPDSIKNNLRKHFPSFELDPEACRKLLADTKTAILEYFSKQTPLPAIPLDMRSGTAFQKKVWQSLCRIPFGETRSYLDIARITGKPKAARAVGQACGKNPIALVVPCHRVISEGGKLGGYSGGLNIKKALLKLENIKFAT